MNNSKAHSELLDDLLFDLGSRPDTRCWVRNVGFDESRKIHYGIKGETDLQGITKGGRAFFIEVKTGTGRLSKNQKLFRDMVLRFGAIYILARNREQVLAEFESQL